MSFEPPIPETKVLAIASHVVYGYVGNTIATLVMQTLGCDVSALNTVHFSNHTGYGQFKGTRTSAQEMRDIYDGLCQSYLTDFDMLLSGYAPSADTVETVGFIARDLRFKSTNKPGSFFWVLDPVMGDQGRLYVNENVVPAYKSIIRHADLILPNQFEAEILSGITMHSLPSIATAISTLHTVHQIPHILVTSIRLSPDSPTLFVIGSTARSDKKTPRLFQIQIPALPCIFTGTGDMFAALMVVRLREACLAAGVAGRTSWTSPDDVSATELPLAKATEKVLASMQMILEKTVVARDAEAERLMARGGDVSASSFSSAGRVDAGADGGEAQRRHLAETKAGEVRVVRNVRDLWEPEERYTAAELEELD